MRWTPAGTSPDIEDRRGFRIPGGGKSIGLLGFVVLAAMSLIFKQNFFALFDGSSGGGTAVQQPGPVQTTPAEDRQVQFVSFVLDDVQNTWTKALPPQGANYQRARLVLFRDYVQSGCGNAQAAMGPFYCPLDRKVYLDLSFFDELRTRFGAPGEFAAAYVVAHEIGHHVQNQLGLDKRMRAAQQQDPRLANQLSVRFELQADCLAGVWGHSTAQRDILEKGDVESGMAAASAVGDDRIQKQRGGRVAPESWTHGSSQQRVEWFTRGLRSGRVEACDTFAQ